MCIKGRYFFSDSSDVPAPRPFQKPWLSLASQVALLASRGLIVNDPAAAEGFLSHVNYYRFSGYCLAFETGRHRFRADATFEAIRRSYLFDLSLRDLLSEALEVVEVDVRTAMAHRLGEQYGAFGHVSASNFYSLPVRTQVVAASKASQFQHPLWLKRLRGEAARSKELFVKHFGNNYIEFPDLPIWIVTEVMTFGSLSRLFEGLKKPDKKAIAGRYGVQPHILESWLHHLVYIRNLCAHHARIWDRIWSISPMIPAGKSWEIEGRAGKGHLASTLYILSKLVRRCATFEPFATEWKLRVEELLGVPPEIPDSLFHMGLNDPLSGNALWKSL